MKRTVAFFAIAAALALGALLVRLLPALQKPTAQPSSDPVVVPPVPGVQTSGDVLRLSAALSDPYVLAGGQREVFAKVDIDAASVASSGQRAPVNLAVVLDRSGSMAGEKIEACRRAARQLVKSLDERDRFALVTFGSDATTLIASTLATPDAKERMLAAIDGIAEMGGTNISGGLEAGLAELVAHRKDFNSSRIVLLSDGQANEGVSDPVGLQALARRIAAQDVTLSSIGVGLDFNEYVLESLAEHGGGAYHFLEDAERLASILGAELKQAMAAVAQSPTLAVVPLGGAAVAEVYGYLSETQGGVTTVRMPDFVSGQSRKVVVRMFVPANFPGTVEVARLSLAYTDLTRNRAPGAAQVSVHAAVTNDAALVQSHRNKDVGAVAAHANALQALRRAASATQEGRRAEAERELRQAEDILQKAQADFGPNDDFARALGEAKSFAGALAAPAGSAEANRGAKRMHSFSYEAR
jgi:Ca-activated chloride channel family protein